MVEARTRHVELSCVGSCLCWERFARITVDAEQNRSFRKLLRGPNIQEGTIEMPIILWLLGVPIVVIVLLYLLNIV
jgi:hypothetical protein